MSRFRSPLAIILLAIAPPVLAQPPADVGPRDVGSPLVDREDPAPVGLVELYRALAESWEGEDARAIARLAGGGRVHVVLQRASIGERLAASQLQYLFEEVFDSTEELLLRFPVRSTYDPSTGTAYAVGERTFRERPGIDPVVDRVFVAARMERGSWVLTELRLTSK